MATSHFPLVSMWLIWYDERVGFVHREDFAMKLHVLPLIVVVASAMAVTAVATEVVSTEVATEVVSTEEAMYLTAAVWKAPPAI